MARLRIEGGHPIHGTFAPRGNKNAVLPMLAACLLTDQPITLENIPLIKDVMVMVELLEALGVQIERRDHTVTLHAAAVQQTELDADLCARVRTSILMAGPLAARHGSATIHPPGGDVIGRRRLDTHFHGLGALGVDIKINQAYHFSSPGLIGAEIVLDEASVTATENILMAATLAEGETIIYNAACEPHVQDLAHLLNAMGACVSGMGTNRIHVQGSLPCMAQPIGFNPTISKSAASLLGRLNGRRTHHPSCWRPLILNILQRPMHASGCNGRLMKPEPSIYQNRSGEPSKAILETIPLKSKTAFGPPSPPT